MTVHFQQLYHIKKTPQRHEARNKYRHCSNIHIYSVLLGIVAHKIYTKVKQNLCFFSFSPEEVKVTNISASPFRLNYRSLTNLDKNEPNSTARPKKRPETEVQDMHFHEDLQKVAPG